MLNNFSIVIKDASLECYNTYGIKTSCDYLIKPINIEELIQLMQYISDNKLKYYILGKGSNVILPDTKYRGIIISLERLNNVSINGNIVVAECGVTLSNLVMQTVNNSLGGLQYFSSIPGSLGGALFGNASLKKDHYIYDYLKNIDIIRNNKLMTLKKEDIMVEYRHTSFKESNDILVRATFELKKENKNEMLNLIDEIRNKRKDTQPIEYKNAGSVFKNPDEYSAGYLIENAGLKGFHINDAYISEKHANFIINKGNAKSEDIKNLIDYIKNKVYEKYKIKLELEQIIVKWD